MIIAILPMNCFESEKLIELVCSKSNLIAADEEKIVFAGKICKNLEIPRKNNEK